MMDRKEIFAYLGEDWRRVNDLIVKSLENDIELLTDTNGTILSHSGKQIRPVLALLMARACSGGVLADDSIRYAAAAELLHNATLLHDDVADSSMVRRGSPTVNSVLGGTASVLVGDFWLVRAMEILLDSQQRDDSVIRLFSKTLSNLAEGEMLQLQKAMRGDTTEEDYLRIIYCKTATLFEATCVSAAISVKADEQMIEAARKFAVNLGLAFQIKDDILDYSGDDIGKPVGVDIKEQKITLPLLGALSKVSAARGDEVRKMICEIHDHPENSDAIFDFVKAEDGISYAKGRLYEYEQRALEALDVLPDSMDKEYLKQLAGYTADRTR